MSNYNIPEPQYVPTSGAVLDMQKQMINAMSEVKEAEQHVRDEEAARAKKDISRTKAWGDGLAANANGDSMNEGILDATYAGSNKEYANLKRITEDQPELCATPDCAAELDELRVLEQAPDKTIGMIGNLQGQFEVLGTENLDTSHPLYDKMKAAQSIMDQLSGYGSEQGYGIKVNRLKGENDKFNGQQEIVLTAPCNKEVDGGCPFGESGEWKINSDELDRLTNKDNVDFMPTTPNQKEQYNEISTKSGIFLDESDGTKLSPNMFVYDKSKEPNADGTFDYEYEIVEEVTTNENGDVVAYSYKVPKVNEDAIRSEAAAFTSVEVDTMFDESAGGPDEAISGWNKNGLDKAIKPEQITALLETDPDAEGILNDDGSMNWNAMGVPDKNGDLVPAPGDKGSLYGKDGKVRPAFLQLYKDTYTENYINTNIKGFIDQHRSLSNHVPGSYARDQENTITASQAAANRAGELYEQSLAKDEDVPVVPVVT